MNENKDIQVVVAGHICFDVIPKFQKSAKTKMDEIFIPGKLINMGSVMISTGGPVSNTGIALSTLGIKTKLMGKIGNDYFGEGVLKLLKERNAADYMVVSDGEETSYTVVIVPPGFDRIFLHNAGANNTFCSDDINFDLVKTAKLFHFGYPPLMKKIFENDGEELLKIFKTAKKLGVTTSLDMSLPDASSESGSGDSSIAGFLAAFLNGKTIEESIRIACAVGGQNVQAFDAVSGVKTWDETLEMIPSWGKNLLNISGDYWQYNDKLNMRIGRMDINHQTTYLE